MFTAVFDTHAYVKRMRSAGFTEEQAEIQAEAMSEIIDDKLVTKRDMEDVRQDMKDIRQDIKDTRKDMERDIKDMEYRLIIKLGSLIALGVGLVATLSRLH